MRINSQESARVFMKVAGATLGAVGGGLGALYFASQNPELCLNIAHYIIRPKIGPVSKSMATIYVAVYFGSTAGALAGWRLADRVAGCIFGRQPHRA